MNQLQELNQVAETTGQLALSKDGVFGPTFQGEGPSLGRRCYFLRLAGCNQHCSWCDTPYTWAFSDRLAALHRDGKRYDINEEVHKASAQDILEELYGLTSGVPSMLVISGGEPMLQQKRLVPLCLELVARGWRIEIETAGTIYPLAELSRMVQFNVSLKLENSGNPLSSRYRPGVITSFKDAGNAAWKFVATSQDDLAEIRHIVRTHRLSPVFIMPEGITREDVTRHMQEIAQAVLDEGWNLTPRLQVEIWGNKRGV